MGEEEVSLGDRARDKVTGFEGTVTSKHEYLGGHTMVTLSPTTRDRDGKLIEAESFYLERIERIQE